MPVQLRRAATRFTTTTPWLTSRHSFSFGAHYDPDNTHHGLLMVSNDDVVAPGTGFDLHPHRDMEIVTWVLGGSLLHEDSAGHRELVYPGLAQRMTAGTGILHTERAADGRDPVRFVQMWVLPDTAGAAPGYQQLDVTAELARGSLVPVASGRPGADAAIRIGQRAAALHAARLAVDGQVAVPDAPFVHLFVARGAVAVEGIGPLAEGDAVRLTGAGARRVCATAPAEVLVWEMHATLTAPAA